MRGQDVNMAGGRTLHNWLSHLQHAGVNTAIYLTFDPPGPRPGNSGRIISGARSRHVARQTHSREARNEHARALPWGWGGAVEDGRGGRRV